MNEREIANVLSETLAFELADHTIVYENRDTIPARPYIVVEFVRVSTTDDTLGGGFAISRGYMQATVVTEAGELHNEGLGIAEDIVDAFPYGTRLDASDSMILITKPPAIGQGFRDGPDWRTPVRVDYEAEEQ